jgi:hypothetical protein
MTEPKEKQKRALFPRPKNGEALWLRAVKPTGNTVEFRY